MAAPTLTPTFVAAQSPDDEADRLAALRSYGVLDTDAEEAFDDLTELAAPILETPIALVTLADGERQWFKSKVGIDVAETHRDLAFCAHAILVPEDIFIVEDALQDARFRAHPLVQTEPHIRFYAGVPLVAPSGHPLGTLCAIDRVPRVLSAAQVRALRALARQVQSQLELRKKTRSCA